MKNTILVLFLIIFAISCKNGGNDKPPVILKPQSPMLAHVPGFTGGTNWDGWKDRIPGAEVYSTARHFYLMEIDHNRKLAPKDVDEYIACESPCDDVTCWGSSQLAANKSRLCNWSKAFDEITVSLECIVPYSGKPHRSWPNKQYTYDEWGGQPLSIIENVSDYTTAMLKSYTNTNVKIFEPGNEPWGGDLGREGWLAISLGTIQAFSDFYGSENTGDWGIKLATPAFNLGDKPLQNFDYMIPTGVRKYYDYYTIHPYNFDNSNQLTIMPEDSDGEYLKSLIDMNIWLGVNAPHAKINVTEMGWNSTQVGEILQSAYSLRALLVAMRYGVQRFYFYELIDQPAVDLFPSMGFLNKDKSPKLAWVDLWAFMEEFGSYKYYGIINESEDYYCYLMGDGSDFTVIAWRPTSTEEETRQDRAFVVNWPDYINGPDMIRIDGFPRRIDISIDWTKIVQ